MTTTERTIVVGFDEGRAAGDRGERVLVIVDDNAAAVQVDALRDTLEHYAREMAASLGVSMLVLASAFVRLSLASAAATERLEPIALTCSAEPIDWPRHMSKRPARRLPGPVPDRIVRRAMRGRGWQR